MTANNRYMEIARQSLKENQAEFHDQMQADDTLDSFLANRVKQAEEMASNIYQANLAAGVQPGMSWIEADSQAIRDNLLFPSVEEQETVRDGYHD